VGRNNAHHGSTNTESRFDVPDNRYQASQMATPQAGERAHRGKDNIPCAEATLATMAVRGGGPPYSRVGNTALYAEDNLDEWALEKLSTPRRSTSEERQHGAREPSCDPHQLTREPARSG
jgi:hypothetical protein